MQLLLSPILQSGNLKCPQYSKVTRVLGCLSFWESQLRCFKQASYPKRAKHPLLIFQAILQCLKLETTKAEVLISIINHFENVGLGNLLPIVEQTCVKRRTQVSQTPGVDCFHAQHRKPQKGHHQPYHWFTDNIIHLSSMFIT